MKLKINEILEESGNTKYWLMKKTGATYQTIQKLCTGQTRSIQFDTLEKICKALNCTPNDIIQIEYDSDLHQL